MASLFRIASGGVADYMWRSRLAPKYPGLTPLEIGARRFAREEGNFSYKNCVVAEQDGAVISMLFTFPIVERHEADGEAADPIIKTVQSLAARERRDRVVAFWVAFSEVVIIARRLVREGWSRYRQDGRSSRRP